MATFLTTLFVRDALKDGTQRAAIETVVNAREQLQKAGNRLSDTIRDVMDSNDRITRRRRSNEIPPA